MRAPSLVPPPFVAIVAITAVLAPCACLADGMPMREGRFDGPVIVLELASEQAHELDEARAWRRTHGPEAPRSTWPRIFLDGLALTPAQRDHLVARGRGVPRRVMTYETRDGETDCGCGACNRALRFDDDHVELPVEYLMSDRACEALDREIHGD